MSFSGKFKTIFNLNKTQTIGEIIESLGSGSFGLIIVLLSLPIALPFTPPGLGTFFGVLILITSLQMLLMRKSIWLPKFMIRREVKLKGSNKFFTSLIQWLEFFERVLKRRQVWVLKRPFYFVTASSLVIASVGLITLGFLPLFNSLISVICLVLGLAILQEDGLAGLVGVLATVGMVIAVITSISYILNLYTFLV